MGEIHFSASPSGSSPPARGKGMSRGSMMRLQLGTDVRVKQRSPIAWHRCMDTRVKPEYDGVRDRHPSKPPHARPSAQILSTALRRPLP